MVQNIESKQKKEEITLRIMSALPEWFSPPESIAEKAKEHRELPFFAVIVDDRAVGFLSLKIHNTYTAEIYNFGILKAYQRKGYGHACIEACERFCKERGMRYITVKTLDKSANYKPYVGTRAFYHKEGFIPLEVFPSYWNKENPCLYLVKAVEV